MLTVLWYIELFRSFFWKNSRIARSFYEINWPLFFFHTDQNWDSRIQSLSILTFGLERVLSLIWPLNTNIDEGLTDVSSRPRPWCDLTRNLARKSTSGANRLPLRNWLPATQIFTIFLVKSQSVVLNYVIWQVISRLSQLLALIDSRSGLEKRFILILVQFLEIFFEIFLLLL